MVVWNGILFISMHNYEEWSCQQVYTIHSLKLPSKNASTGLFFQKTKKEKKLKNYYKTSKYRTKLTLFIGVNISSASLLLPFCIHSSFLHFRSHCSPLSLTLSSLCWENHNCLLSLLQWPLAGVAAVNSLPLLPFLPSFVSCDTYLSVSFPLLWFKYICKKRNKNLSTIIYHEFHYIYNLQKVSSPRY